jgi:ketosteroid isomerase-like protein
MYHTVVRARIISLFDAVSQGNATPVLDAFAPKFEHSFLGDSALGGSRRTITATRKWYERLYRLLPDIKFTVNRVSVSGGPWNTLVLAEWEEQNSGTDGVLTRNRGAHLIHLRWGKATKLLICPDTVALKATLDRLGARGTAEAWAPPILDHSPTESRSAASARSAGAASV